jgi:hypothetical protein
MKKRIKRGQSVKLPGNHGSIHIERGGAVIYKAPKPRPIKRNPKRKPTAAKKTARKKTAPKWTPQARAFARKMKAARARKSKGGKR